jgi:hypothetical protein
MRVDVYERAGPFTQWRKVAELVSERRAHFEYAQRTPLPELTLSVA